MSEVIWLDEEEVLAVRGLLAKSNIGRADFGAERALYPDRLASAVSRQSVGSYDSLKWTALHHVAATLFFGLATNHAFDNGNKRTALMAMLVLIQKNGQSLAGIDQDELYELAKETADWKKSPYFATSDPDDVVRKVGTRVRACMRKPEKGFRPMRMKDFLTSLTALGCEVEPPDRSFVRIHPPSGSDSGRTVKVAYAGEGREVDKEYVAKIRKGLGLTLEDGVDAAAFFDLAPVVETFVVEYADVLRRLADT